MITDEEFEIESWKLALTLADLPTKALGLTKRAILLGATNTFDEQLEVERTLQSEAGITADFKEGVLAFTEKRKPNFTGK